MVPTSQNVEQLLRNVLFNATCGGGWRVNIPQTVPELLDLAFSEFFTSFHEFLQEGGTDALNA